MVAACSQPIAAKAAGQSHQSRRQLDPLPHHPDGRRLCEIFSYRWQAILAPQPDRADQKPAWYTETRYPLRPRVLWNLWQDAQQLVGVRFGHQTRYAVIDVDTTSAFHPHHSASALTEIQHALESIGLCRSLLVQSSWSGGLHLYLPLPEAVPTFGLAIALRDCLTQAGFNLQAGQLETFPNVKRYGRPGEFVEYNAHRLPLQPGSGSRLLQESGRPCYGGLGEFWQQWEQAAAQQDSVQLHSAIAQARQTFRPVSGQRHNRFSAWQQDLETELTTGWTDHGQTNHLLKAIACYGVVFRGLSGDALITYIHHTATQAPGYDRWCRHHHEIWQRCTEWAIAAERHYWSPQRSARLQVTAQPSPALHPNEQRAIAAQHRIQTAVQALQSAGQLPAGITACARAIAAQANCSFSTLQKYRHLWHPHHVTQPSGADSAQSAPAQPSPQSNHNSTATERSRRVSTPVELQPQPVSKMAVATDGVREPTANPPRSPVIARPSSSEQHNPNRAQQYEPSANPLPREGLQANSYMKGFNSLESAIAPLNSSDSGSGGVPGGNLSFPQADVQGDAAEFGKSSGGSLAAAATARPADYPAPNVDLSDLIAEISVHCDRLGFSQGNDRSLSRPDTTLYLSLDEDSKHGPQDWYDYTEVELRQWRDRLKAIPTLQPPPANVP